MASPTEAQPSDEDVDMTQQSPERAQRERQSTAMSALEGLNADAEIKAPDQAQDSNQRNDEIHALIDEQVNIPGSWPSEQAEQQRDPPPNLSVTSIFPVRTTSHPIQQPLRPLSFPARGQLPLPRSESVFNDNTHRLPLGGDAQGRRPGSTVPILRGEPPSSTRNAAPQPLGDPLFPGPPAAQVQQQRPSSHSREHPATSAPQATPGARSRPSANGHLANGVPMPGLHDEQQQRPFQHPPQPPHPYPSPPPPPSPRPQAQQQQAPLHQPAVAQQSILYTVRVAHLVHGCPGAFNFGIQRIFGRVATAEAAVLAHLDQHVLFHNRQVDVWVVGLNGGWERRRMLRRGTMADPFQIIEVEIAQAIIVDDGLEFETVGA